MQFLKTNFATVSLRFVYTLFMTNSVPNHRIEQITFLGSFPKVNIAPKHKLPEFAFIGRSNVGKSSLINYLCDRKKLAKTSSTPGKTQLINLFEVDKKWVLADLPGYGYARISKKMRAKWSVMIEAYLQQRESLVTVFLLIDSRVSPQQSDLEQLTWLGENHIPFSIIFTKADKLKQTELDDNIAVFLKALGNIFDEEPNYFITSSAGRRGADEVLDYIDYVANLD